MDSRFQLPEEYVAGNMPLPAVWDHHAENSPNHPLFVYEDKPGDIRTVTWRQGNQATHRAARIVQRFAQRCGQRIIDSEQPPVIGIMAVKGSLLACPVHPAALRLTLLP